LKLSKINIYPIKSVTGFSLKESIVEPQGLADDRLYMLVDNNGLFITQRKYHQLALVNSEIINNKLIINAPNCKALEISLDDFSPEITTVTVWKDSCEVFIANNKVNQWFTQYLNFSVRLVKYNKVMPRKSDPDYSQENDIVSFADGFPLLLTSSESLKDLNSRLETAVTMNHFRANLVIDGFSEFEEDHWKKIKIGTINFDVVKPCSRCILTTINPATGVKNTEREPLKTLTEYRKEKGGVMFGMNLIPRSHGIISMNDKVLVLK
jgi:uncharacterized protein YcbX